MESVIKVEKLSKSYAHIRAIKDVDISICRGEVFGLLGANGAGKSTTIECILGTKKQDSGTVSILGMNPQKDRKKLFERVGVQFQEANYQDKIRVAELCEVTASLYKTSLDYANLLKQFGLSDKLKNQVSELSGGQKQRIALARALLVNPEILILDEATSSVDTETEYLIQEGLDEVMKGRTSVIIAKRLSTVRGADKIVIMDEGRISMMGTHEELLSRPGFYRRLFESQFAEEDVDKALALELASEGGDR